MSFKHLLPMVIAATIFTIGTATKAGSASPPSAPPQLCAGTNCATAPVAVLASSVTSSSTKGVKWHPGHYVISNARPSTPATASISRAAMNDMSAAKGPAGRFMGYQGEYTWYYLENASGGAYRFDIIDADLAYLAAKSAADGVDYKLIIYLSCSESLAGAASTPQPVAYSAGAGSSSRSIAPDYIISGITPGAGPGVLNNANGQAVVALWRPGEMTAFIHLVNALGARYDANPQVEAIIPIYEMGENIGNIVANDPTYSPAQFMTQLGRLAAAMQTSWPTTNKIFFNNWVTSGMSTGQLAALTQTFIASGFGMGGPDILYNTGGFPTTGALISLGQSGSANFVGKVPLLYEEQANSFNWTSQTSAGTEAYAYGTLNATHLAWADIPAGEVNYPMTEWPSIVSALNAVNFRVHSACPSNYSNGCNTQ
jgi:hypothetical protein